MFVGPTLSAEQVVERVPGAVVHPPVAHGDLLRLSWEPDDVVVIVDGYYHQTGAVRHKEVLELLAAGVTVVGCASMGALRAAELHELGMLGHGVVFRMYRDGVIDGDDEVAVAHGEEPEYRRFGEPLVNIRHGVAAACEAGVLTPSEAAGVVAAARSIPYTGRSWRAVAEVSGSDAVDRLRAFLTGHPEHADIKATDALETLSRLDEIVAAARRPPPDWIGSRGWRSQALYGWRATFPGTAVDDVHVGHGDVLGYCQLYDPDFPARWQRFALARIEKSSADPAETGPEHDPAPGALEAAARQGVTPATLTPGHLRTWLTGQEAARLSPREALVRMLVRSYRPPRKGYDLVAEWPELTADAAVRAVVAECQAVNAEVASWEAGQSINHIRYATLQDHLVSVWQLPDDDDDTLLAAARDRGFSAVEEAVAAARLYFLREHFLAADHPVAAEAG